VCLVSVSYACCSGTGLAARTLRRYEVLASVDGGPCRRINQADLLCTAFM